MTAADHRKVLERQEGDREEEETEIERMEEKERSRSIRCMRQLRRSNMFVTPSRLGMCFADHFAGY